MTPLATALLTGPVPVLTAGEGPPDYLGPLAALVVAAAAIGYVAARLKVVPIVGFLLAGVVIGPSALGLVPESEAVTVVADIGIILLLFTIGIEFSLGRLARVWVWIVVAGGLQVLLTTAAGAWLTSLAGGGLRDGVYTGFLLALSSTAIVLTMIAQRGESASTRGRLALAVLISQDLAVVAMVLVVPLLGQSSSGDAGEQAAAGATALALAVAKAAAVVLAVIVLARRVMPAVLDVIARLCSPPVFLLSIVAICFGTAYLTSLAGISVSLGAFLAGLVVSESRTSTQALAEVLPLQILFSAVFFVSVGLLLDLSFVADNLLLVLGAAVGVLVVKTVLTTASVMVVRVPWRTALATGLLLAQVGEFSFVILTVGTAAGLSPLGLGESGSQVVVATTVLLMAVSPLLAAAGARAEGIGGGGRGGRRAQATEDLARAAGSGEHPLHDHVVVVGWGPTALTVAATLRDRGVEVLMTTLSPDGAAQAEADGHRVVRGDPLKAEVLREAGLATARAVVVAEDGSEEGARVVAAARAVTGAPIFVRPLDEMGLGDLDELVEAGADHVVDRALASSRALTHSVLEGLDLPLSSTLHQRAQVDVSRPVRYRWPGEDDGGCGHGAASRTVLPQAPGCLGCLREGTEWVHLRVCLTCGYVGCCDSSPSRHARAHAHADQPAGPGVGFDGRTRHPLVASAEEGEGWAYCYLDGTTVPEPASGPRTVLTR